MQVSAKTKDHPQSVSVEMNIPEKLADLVKVYGEDVVASNAKGAIVISAQAFLRRNIDKPQAELQKAADGWKPGVRAAGTRKSAFEKVTDSLSSLTPEQKAELLKQLKSR